MLVCATRNASPTYVAPKNGMMDKLWKMAQHPIIPNVPGKGQWLQKFSEGYGGYSPASVRCSKQPNGWENFISSLVGLIFFLFEQKFMRSNGNGTA
jgi:hypothetical protein